MASSASRASSREFGDDRGHGLANEAHRIDCERMARRRRRRRTVGAAEVRGGRQRLHAGADEILAGDDGDNAGHRDGPRLVDGHDARVRMRRAQEQDVGLSRGVVIVDEATGAHEKAGILDAGNRLAAAKATVLR